MNRSYWLEISETIALFLVGLGAIITLMSDNLLFLVVPMVATLILNKLNRKEKEKQIYHKTLGKLEHLQGQVWSELQSLQTLIQVLQEQDENEQEFKQVPLTTNLEIKPEPSLNGHKNHDQELIEDYEEYILSLEESLNNVIQYLNQVGINQRFQQLEEYYEQMSNEVLHLTRKLNYTSELAQKNTNSAHLLLFGKDNLTHLISENTESTEGTEGTECTEIPEIPEIREKIKETEDPRISKNSEISLPIAQSFTQKWVKLYELSAHENGVTDLIISEDSYFIATVSLDQNLKIWALETGKLLDSTLAHEKGILAIACTQENEENSELFNYILATGGFDYNIKLWEFTTDQQEKFNLINSQVLNGHLGSIRALKMTPDGQILISGSYDKTVKQWTIEDGNLIQNCYDNSSAIQSIAVSYDGKIIASGGEDGKIYFWETETGIKRGSLQGNNKAVKSLNFSGNGELLVAGCSDGSLKLWQLEPRIFREGIQPDPTKILKEHLGEIKSVIFSPCGKYLISGDTYGEILIWLINSGEIIESLNITQDLESEQTRLLSLAVSKDGNYLVAGDGKGNITIWQNN